MSFEYPGQYRPVFENVNLMLSTSWRLGLVGRNGRGKSTLLRLIAGDLKPDRGEISCPVPVEVFPYALGTALCNTRDIIKESIGGLATLETEMAQCLQDGSPEALERYGALLAEYLERDGYSADARIERELRLMDLAPALLDRDFETLSGGEQTKILILCLFLKGSAFVLLDEPTNHLDQPGKRALAAYLAQKSGFIAVSHDRAFLDATSDHILSIVRTDILVEKGNFSSWYANRTLEDAHELRTHENLTREIAVLESSARESRRYSFATEAKKRGAHDRGFIGAQAARLMQRAKNTERRRERMVDEKKRLLRNHEPVLNLKIAQAEAEGVVLAAEGLGFSYGGPALFRGVGFALAPGDRLWVRGRNGSGKSTLLRILRRELPCQEGHISTLPGMRLSVSYQSPLWQEGMLTDLLRDSAVDAGVFRTTLAYFEMGPAYFERPLETFSQGELKKIDIARALAQDNHLLMLDEPLNYMDIHFRQQLEAALQRYRPTLIFVEHDEHFGETVATAVLDLDRREGEGA